MQPLIQMPVYSSLISMPSVMIMELIVILSKYLAAIAFLAPALFAQDTGAKSSLTSP